MKKILLALILLATGLGLWAFWWEPASLKVHEQPLALPNWPAHCQPLRIAVLADLHIGSPHNGLDKLEQIIAATNAATPDLILLPGDFMIQGVIGGTQQSPEVMAPLLGQLHAPLGVHAVLGNHDWWLDAARMERVFKQHGINMLEDRSTLVQHGSCQLQLAGVTDYWEGPHDIGKALSQVAPQDNTIVFTHNPDIFPDIPDHVELTIAGHTHGGQVYIPGVGRPIVPSDHGERYAIGHIEENGKQLYVSPGLGTSILPVRFLVPPEITLLVVQSQ